jgi:LIVCS family branched-chain amino acid:cation transporter
LFLAILFVKAFASPLGDILMPTGSYVDAPYAQGFKDGYQTMDLLASIAIGTLVVNSVRMRGVTGNRAIGKVCIIAGIIALGAHGLCLWVPVLSGRYECECSGTFCQWRAAAG